ncbi:hypothetical protein CC86DRAFT_411101 [Ophiobolus disseminans]|uniref:Uncharacterized protein n=1 Tax=Ophiobolus disseminans TaxID=1469910 RepID=A0A6A6ZL72_9PLEO|nr:hypothetical protein CC86DRAFT_411101 [Ophiobolus disseminans]
MGTWELAMLAKSGDIVFAFAVKDMFDSLAWGSLKESSLQKGYVSLPWFFITWSATGPIALERIKGAEALARTMEKHRKREMELRTLSVSGDIQQRPVYVEAGDLAVSAGLGDYDPRLGESLVNRTQWSTWIPEITKLTLNMLRDRSIAYSTQPMNTHCKERKTCQSYLIV